jgi:hypothetical protein
MSKPGNLFEATIELDRELVAIVDIVKLLAAGLWSLRSNVRGFLGEVPSATADQLEARITAGSGLRYGNFRAVTELTWEQQQERLARFSLLAVVGSFEGWASRLGSSYPSQVQRKLVEALQWPPRGATHLATKPGADVAVQILTASRPTNLVAMRLLQRVASSRPTNAPHRLANLLIAYRAFKELRNCLAHRAQVVDAWTESWCNETKGLTKDDLGLRRPGGLSLHRNVAGHPASISLYEIVGLTAIIRQIAATFDGAAAISLEAEREVLRRFPGQPAHPYLPANPAKRQGQPLANHLTGVLATVGLPSPNASDMPAIVSWLRTEGALA